MSSKLNRMCLKPIYKNNEISIDDLMREFAIVIYKNKLYKAFNHQEALELALNAEGRTLGLKLDNEELLLAEEITKSQHSEGIIYTWNLYSDDTDYYMIASSDNDLNESINNEYIQDMINKYKAKAGYFYSNNKIKLL